MRAVVQRVSRGDVVVDGTVVADIDDGLLVYLGVEGEDGRQDVDLLVDRIRHLRVFSDAQGRMNLDVADVGGSVLVVSAFTVAADARRGRRPSFDNAAPAETAQSWYEQVCDGLERGGLRVERGRFGAMMEIRSCNEGPICILLDSKRRF